MKLDHSEFISRHHKIAQPEEHGLKKRRSFAFLYVISVIAILALFIFMIYSDDSMSDFMKIATSLFTALAACVLLLSYRSHRKNKEKSRELDLIKQVMEGSRGGRLITDHEGKTLYTNQKFDALCRGVGAPGFNAILRLFEGNEEGQAHFRLLAEQAQRGLTDSIELFSSFESFSSDPSSSQSLII